MVADQVGRHAELVAQVGPFLELGRHGSGEFDIEGDGLDLVRLQLKAHALERIDHLVADRPDRGRRGGRREAAAGPHRRLLGASAGCRVAVQDVAVRVTTEPEAQLEVAVTRHGHGAHLLRPGRIARAHDGEGVSDLVGEALVGREQGTDGIGHQVVAFLDGIVLTAVDAVSLHVAS